MARKGTFQARYYINGVTHYASGKTLREAQKKADKLQLLAERGEYTKRENMTVRDWSEICIEQYKTKQKPITRKTYTDRMNHCVLEYIGGMRLKDVKPFDCTGVINKQIGNSAYQINQVYQMLNFLFEKAIDNHYIVENPAKGIERPEGTETTRRALTKYEQKIANKVFELKPEYAFFETMMYCGLRPSEVAELKGMDIQKNGKYNVIHVRRSKSKASDRTVPLPTSLYEKIKGTEPFAYVFPNFQGNKRTKSSIHDLWEDFKRDMNIAMGAKVDEDGNLPEILPLAPDVVPYCFRHTFCTGLVNKLDVRVTRYLMGHSSIEITDKVYTHIQDTDISKAAKKLAK